MLSRNFSSRRVPRRRSMCLNRHVRTKQVRCAVNCPASTTALGDIGHHKHKRENHAPPFPRLPCSSITFIYAACRSRNIENSCSCPCSQAARCFPAVNVEFVAIEWHRNSCREEHRGSHAAAPTSRRRRRLGLQLRENLRLRRLLNGRVAPRERFAPSSFMTEWSLSCV